MTDQDDHAEQEKAAQDRFHDLARKLVRVPKHEIDAERAKEQERKEEQERKDRG